MLGLPGKIFRQAFMLARGHATFWRLGLLLSWPTAIKTFFILAMFTSIMQPESLAGGLAQPGVEAGSAWVGLGASLAISLLALLHFRSSSVLRHAVRHLRTKSDLDMPLITAQAEPHTIALLKSGLLFALAGWAGFVVFASPVAYLAAGQNPALASLLAILAVMVAVPSAVVLYLCSIMAPNFMCLLGMPPIQGLQASMDMVRRGWPSLLKFLGFAWLLEFVGIMACFMAGTAVFGVFVLLFRIFYDMYGLAGPVQAQALAGTLGFMVFFMSLAWVSAVQRIAWTILFLETARPTQPEEQPAVEPVAETVT